MFSLYVTKRPFRVVLATHNAGKVAELATAFEPLGWQIAGMGELGLTSPEETGATFEANALLKARAAAQASGLCALADDSGLEVAALDGEPGVQTAYYGGWEKLLEALKAVPEGQRQARFVCVLALVTPEGEKRFFRGSCEGRISLIGQGDGGFGYDPVFIPEGEDRTFASMSKAEKYGFSHRGKAVEALKDWAMAQNEGV